jgi:hypothetical protein
MHLGTVALEGTIPVWFQSRNTSSVPTAADATPTFAVYEEGSDTALLTGQATTLVTGTTGFYRGSVAATTANGFESGKTYCVRGSWAITTARAELLFFTVA